MCETDVSDSIDDEESKDDAIDYCGGCSCPSYSVLQVTVQDQVDTQDYDCCRAG